MAHTPLLTELIIIAAAGVVAAVVLGRLRLPTLAGLLVAGALVGPAGFGWVSNLQDIEALAELGVVLLLFTIGLEFSLHRLRPIAKLVALGGSLQVGLAVGCTALAAWLWGDSLQRGVFLGFLVALSSTAIVLRALSERGELDAPHGNFIVGVLIFQDLCVVPMVLIVPILAGQAGDGPLLGLLLALGKASAVVAVTLIGVRRLLPLLFRWVDATRSREIFTLAVLVICIGIAWLTSLAGLSLALGAFLAGLVLADTDFRERALGDIMPLRYAFTSLFFISLGMLFDVGVIAAHPRRVALLFLAFVLGKGAVAIVAAMVMRFPARAAWMAGAGLAQFGEFGFVLVKLAEQLGLVSRVETQTVLAAGVLSMLVTPLWLRLAPKLSAGEALLRPLQRLLGVRGVDEPSAEHQAISDHIVVVGFGVGGRLLTRALRLAEVPYLVLEMNAETVRRARAAGEPVYYGDVSSPEALQHARVLQARALVLLINDPDAVRRTVAEVRASAPNTPILVRARFVANAPELRALGADEVVCEELEAGAEMLRRVGQRFDRDDDELAASRRLQALQVRTFLVGEGSHARDKPLSALPTLLGLHAVAHSRGGRLAAQVDIEEPLRKGDALFLLCDPVEMAQALELLEEGGDDAGGGEP